MSLLEFMKHLDDAQTYGLIFGLSCVDQGVGLDGPCDSCRPLPTWDILLHNASVNVH